MSESEFDLNEALITGILEFDTDMEDVEAPKPLPEGTYIAEVIKVEAKKSSTSGKLYTSVTFMIPPEEYPADFDAEMEPNGVVISYNLVPFGVDKKSQYRMREFGARLGVNASGRQLDIHDWEFRKARVTISHRMFNEEPQANIDKVEVI